MTIDNIIAIGFFMGLLGSVHCIGMCGPLVMALPISQKTMFQKGFAIFLYHFGKLSSYGCLGIIVGIFGKHFFIFNAQQHISLFIGVIMLLYVGWVFILKPNFSFSSFHQFQKPILNWLTSLFKSKYITSFYLIGFLNGLLPCGMVYLALTSAFATGNVMHSGLFMILFGVGTAPALLIVAISGQFVGVIFRRKLQSSLPIVIVTMGVLLILRGMNLGIPFVSPHVDIAGNTISCHN